MLRFLKLIKFDNIVFIAFAQLCIRKYLFEPFGIEYTLNSFGISLLVISTASIMAAGNIIIAVYASENRSILKNSSFSEKSANRWFIILNVIGVLLGFYLANLISRPGFAALFIITSGIFYLYASYLKEILVVKNIVPAILVGLSLLVIPIFDLLPAITDQNRSSQQVIFSIILDYALFAFMIIWIREIVKDCLHMDRDHNLGLKTLPISFGKERITKVISIATFIPLVMAVHYIYTYFFNNTTVVVLILIGIVAPLLLFLIRSWTANSKKDFEILSLLLKVILILTTLSILSFHLILL